MIEIGISAFYHDSAVCLLKNGKVISAAEEERFTGVKHDSSFPYNALEYVLSWNKLSWEDVDRVYWYENPILKKDRVLKTFKKYPFRTFFSKRKFLKEYETNDPLNLLDNLGFYGPVRFVPHHRSHANFAYYTSPYKDAAILNDSWEFKLILFCEESKIWS